MPSARGQIIISDALEGGREFQFLSNFNKVAVWERHNDAIAETAVIGRVYCLQSQVVCV